MRDMDISLMDCPQILQDEVSASLARLPSEVIAVQRFETTPFKDKTIIVTRFKAYLQLGYEVAIYSTQVTTGMEVGNSLDGEVGFDSINLHEIETIALRAKWFGDSLRRLLNDNHA